MVKALLGEINIDLNARDASGRVTLHWAAMDGASEVIRVLVDRGADVNLRDCQQFTALCLAARSNSKASDFLPPLKMLLGAPNIDVNLSDDSGRTALHWVVMKRVVDRTSKCFVPERLWTDDAVQLIEKLLDQGANVNLQDSQGCTALYLAVENHNFEAVKLLSKVPGIDLNLKEAVHGWTALYKAAKIQTWEYSFEMLRAESNIDVEVLTEALELIKDNVYFSDAILLFKDRIARTEAIQRGERVSVLRKKFFVPSLSTNEL
ncbi:ankyrin repeat-containing domain protein [Lophiotrema nucula]|uniref:Ankyrin repeat-containing domain protein n=1 Tax=Lophiotrema nucula TaxID=690887 RepID=A0A6A5Z9D6_9PLEO|nr:ankyrin repeat-containing domain protein [Lophiotrema nucula]